MPVRQRALVIAYLGPALQALGLSWEALHIAIAHWSVPLSARHLMYEPGVLMLIVGLLLTIVCLPVALDVVSASEEDVEIPLYGPSPAQTAARPHRRRRQERRAPGH